MRRGFALVWTLVTAAIAAVVGVFTYQAGFAAGLATKLPEGAAAAPYWYYAPHVFGFGFGIFPLLLVILVLFLLFRGFAGRGRWGKGWGYPGSGGPGGPQAHMEQRLREWHEKAHTEPPASGSTA